MSCSIKLPLENGYTMYSKNNCKFCSLAKKYFDDIFVDVEIINTENYDRDEFVSIIKKNILKSCPNLPNDFKLTYPIIFKDNKYIGGFTDLIKNTI